MTQSLWGHCQQIYVDSYIFRRPRGIRHAHVHAVTCTCDMHMYVHVAALYIWSCMFPNHCLHFRGITIILVFSWSPVYGVCTPNVLLPWGLWVSLHVHVHVHEHEHAIIPHQYMHEQWWNSKHSNWHFFSPVILSSHSVYIHLLLICGANPLHQIITSSLKAGKGFQVAQSANRPPAFVEGFITHLGFVN